MISTVYATPLMTPTTDLGLSIRLSTFEFRETGDWDIFLGPPERARAESDSVFSKDALLPHKRERKRTGIPLNPCLVGRGVMPTAR